MENLQTGMHTEAFTSTAICDVKQGVLNMGNNPELFRKHIGRFKRNSREIIQQLEGFLSQNDYRNASILCHSIKGLSGMLGLTTLHVHMKEAEFFFRDLAQKPEEYADRLEQMQRKVRGITTQLANDIGQVCAAEF